MNNITRYLTYGVDLAKWYIEKHWKSRVRISLKLYNGSTVTLPLRSSERFLALSPFENVSNNLLMKILYIPENIRQKVDWIQIYHVDQDWITFHRKSITYPILPPPHHPGRDGGDVVLDVYFTCAPEIPVRREAIRYLGPNFDQASFNAERTTQQLLREIWFDAGAPHTRVEVSIRKLVLCIEYVLQDNRFIS